MVKSGKIMVKSCKIMVKSGKIMVKSGKIMVKSWNNLVKSGKIMKNHGNMTSFDLLCQAGIRSLAAICGRSAGVLGVGTLWGTSRCTD